MTCDGVVCTYRNIVLMLGETVGHLGTRLTNVLFIAQIATDALYKATKSTKERASNVVGVLIEFSVEEVLVMNGVSVTARSGAREGSWWGWDKRERRCYGPADHVL